MGASDVIATDESVRLARNGILIQLGATDIAKNYDSLSHALHDLGMWDFVENLARVHAQYSAFDARNMAIINELTMAGAFVTLNLIEDE